ncbi:undecaprenyl-phosphate N-acetylglucosaminyl 1-phosphate transferase [Tetragenococcus muriaticus PMC-11-5]|uniref:Undecaprenyl-phosphate N-acetylglucosaminyl 1-phosphate transferase n=1 Tax=Tetragenococcus muriaticus PMC-11-5 TaxID=1302649 RepID=A0A091C7K8_9ENTE|nr:undecaprenyl-phosphate N-acetylglucosaminyl 1-phosphate transferase [Tetragenococcus muriaticus PMC-11-5]
MGFTFQFILKLIATMFLSVILTPLLKLLSFKIGAVDRPDERRVNNKTMPTAGGLSIFISFTVAVLWEFNNTLDSQRVWPMLIAAFVIVLTGLMDDIYEITPAQKTLGIIFASLVVYFIGDIGIDALSIPFVGSFQLDWLRLPMTLIWILAITNAVNLIDGLDGLACGVAVIALVTIGLTSYFFLPTNGVPLAIMIFSLVAAITGFFPYNFHPAAIYLGDTGALFLGFMISVFLYKG